MTSRELCAHCGARLPPGAHYCNRCGTPVSEEPAPVLAQLREALGAGYEVVGELGRGGFAIVYLVHDPAAGRHLAVKVMRQELVVSPVLVERFRREIRYASRLDHPNILPVVFAAEEGALVYYAMPRVRGKTLRKVLEERRPFPIAEALRVLRETGRGLAHAHANGVVHRDMKPSNVMLDESGRVLILDFGLARALAGDEGTLTTTGELMGSPQYMSPEQAAGIKGIDHRTDIYSWGIIGYEMLAGRPPFEGASVPEILFMQRTAIPASLRLARPDIPPAMASAIERALEKDREKRWESIDEAVEALGETVKGEK